MRVTFCESCGAPLEARWAEIVLVCRYCGAHNAPGKPGQPVPPSIPDDGRPRLVVGGRTYVIEGLLAAGDSSDVYRGRWVVRLGELVVIKVLRALGDADLLRREWAFLERLCGSAAAGTAHFAGRLPQPIALGPVRCGKVERLVAVYRWQSGFFHTLEEVTSQHPGGIDPRAAVWLLKRLLELLSFAHRSGVVHGAVLPPHVLVHPRDHGATLVGWSVATGWAPGAGEPLPAISRAWQNSYPAAASGARRVEPASDVAMAARAVLAAAAKLPGGLGELVAAAAAGDHADAWTLCERVDEQARVVFGPPEYRPLSMPGWTTT